MPDWVQRWLPAAMAFLLGAQLVAAFTVDDDDASTRVATRATTTTTSTTASSNETTTTAATETTAGGSRPTRATTAATTAPAFAGPKAGEYRYRVDSKITDEGETTNESYDAQLVVTEVGGGRQRHRFLEQGGVSAVDDLVWRADGRYVVATEGGDGSTGCDLEPDIRTAPTPATPGTTKFKSSCTIRLEGEPPETVTLSGSFKVVGTTRKTVAGAPVDVVHFHIEFDDDDPSDGPDSMVIDEFYAPSLRLTVEETQHSFGAGEYEDGERYTYDELSTRRLVSSQPS